MYKKVKSQKGLLVLLLLIVLALFFFLSQKRAPKEPVFCTMDAKMCPDGSFVGREGPNCEFAPCPGEK